MRLTNVNDVEAFIKTVDSCTGNVYLTSPYGDKFNLKSKLSQYVAIGGLIQNADSNMLELWCDYREDENKFITFFSKHPEAL